MNTCNNCHGEGLVGQGDKPWLKVGKVETCGECKGTGKVGDEVASSEVPAEASAEPVNAPVEPAVDSPAPDPLAEAPSAELEGASNTGGEALAEAPGLAPLE